MNTLKVGEFIKEKRKNKGLTQRELADKLNITDRAVSKWERGICCPDISLLKELCSILDISINELLSGEDIEKLEIEQSEDILVETVKQYTKEEKKKNRKLLIFTIMLLVFYVGLVFTMYLTYNQVNKTDGLNWEVIQTKKVAERFYTAIENYDYDTIRKMQIESYGHGQVIMKDSIEDESKCSEYEEQRENGERLSGPGLICKLKYFEEKGLEFISHKFSTQFYVSGYGEFSVVYKLEARYKDTKINLSSTMTAHNGVITYMGIGWEDTYTFFEQQYPDIFNNINAFFGNYDTWEE